MSSSKGEIYMLTCNITNKKYIGQAVQFINCTKQHGTEGRWKKHVIEAKSGSTKCRALNCAIRKYGAHNFTVRTLLICEVRQMNYYEYKFVRQYNTICPNGYNIRTGGGSKARHNQESIEKLRQAKTGKNHHMYGKKHSNKTIEKMSKTKKGISKAHMRKDENKDLPMYIYKYTAKRNPGYCVKHHPRMKVLEIKCKYFNMKSCDQDNLQDAIDFLASLSIE